MKILFKILSVLFVVAVVLHSCTAPIDIKTDDAAPRLVIFGYITNQQGVHSVQISRTNGYFSADRPPVISNASVTISYDDIVFMLQEDPFAPGTYLTDKYFQGEEGKTYTLNVVLDFDNDGTREYYRAVATMPYATRVDSVVLQPSEKIKWLADLLLYGYVPAIQENNLALYLIKNSEEKKLLEYFMVIPDWYFKGNDIQGYRFPCMVKDGIAVGDTITFRVASFSEDFAEFVSHAKSEAGGSNPLFGGPPADVKSNVIPLDPDNETPIVGYFGAFPVDEKSTISDRNYLSGS